MKKAGDAHKRLDALTKRTLTLDESNATQDARMETDLRRIQDGQDELFRAHPQAAALANELIALFQRHYPREPPEREYWAIIDRLRAKPADAKPRKRPALR